MVDAMTPEIGHLYFSDPHIISPLLVYITENFFDLLIGVTRPLLTRAFVWTLNLDIVEN